MFLLESLLQLSDHVRHIETFLFLLGISTFISTTTFRSFVSTTRILAARLQIILSRVKT